ncbi:MAG: ATP-binding cassette domain-containing protein [Fimbriimonadaceae bacterium]|nr:ATP-binding cassette domain-containing protein [Fimbriimonadaceae bacterium]
MVSVQRLTRHFQDPKRGTVKAVDDVSFEARPGTVLGVLGANGAGKTTLLRTLATILPPTSGTAVIAGRDIVREPEAVRGAIGFLSATTSVYGRLTVLETLQYFGRLYGLEERFLQVRIESVTASFGLESFLGTLGDRLSTGQKQRANIARAVIHDPGVVFLDEPTAGLDVVAAQGVLEFIEKCRDEDKTVLVSSHVMSEIERLCDEIVVIHDGTVRAASTPASLVAESGAPSLEAAFLEAVGYEKGARL